MLGALFVQQWMGVFPVDPAIKSIGASDLAINGPAYALLGAGSGLFYASQGLGSVSGPFFAQTSRLAVLVIVGWVAMPLFRLRLQELFIANAATIASVGIALIFAFWQPSRQL